MASGLMFDDIDLKSTFNFVTSNVVGRGLPPVQRDVLDFPQIPGGIVLSEKWGARSVTISGYVYDYTKPGALDKADRLLKLFGTSFSADKKLGFPDTGQALHVRLATGEVCSFNAIGPVFGSHIFEIHAAFTAYNPFFFDSGTNPVFVPQNLLFHGSFESDSNGDGLADGWSKDTLSRAFIHDGFHGSNSQRLYLNNTFGTDKYISVYQSGITVQPGTTIFAAAHMRVSPANTSVNSPHLKISYADSATSTAQTVTGSWGRVFKKISLPQNAMSVRVDCGQNVEPGRVGSFQSDAVCVYDLVPLGLQDKTEGELNTLLGYTGLDG